MYQGKHIPRDSRRAPRKNRRFRWNRQFVLLVSILALLVGIVGSSLAYLITQTRSVENTFQPSKVTCRIDENFNGSVKSNVKVTNTGDTDAYIRAALVFTWVDSKGNIAPNPVGSGDYTLETGSDWTLKSDGFYYYNQSVAPGEKTTNLIVSCAPVSDKAPTGYTLCVDVIADAIQSKGLSSSNTKPVVDAWKVDPVATEASSAD